MKFRRNFGPQEDQERVQIFVKNLDFIESHNERYRNGEVTYEVGLNQFSDRREDELRQKKPGLRRRQNPNEGQVPIEALLS